MNVSIQQLHDMIDIVDTREYDVLYRLLAKFIPEDDPLPDEILAIEAGRAEIARGESVSHDDINWN